jgi:hypothetical protein
MENRRRKNYPDGLSFFFLRLKMETNPFTEKFFNLVRRTMGRISVKVLTAGTLLWSDPLSEGFCKGLERSYNREDQLSNWVVEAINT